MVVPPRWLVKRRAAATLSSGPVVPPFPPALSDLSVAIDLLEYAVVELGAKAQNLEWSGGTRQKQLDVLTSGPASAVVTDQVAVHDPQRPRQPARLPVPPL